MGVLYSYRNMELKDVPCSLFHITLKFVLLELPSLPHELNCIGVVPLQDDAHHWIMAYLIHINIGGNNFDLD